MNYPIQEIIKSKRKTISIQVNEDGKLIIKIPKSLKKDELNLLLLKHHTWIQKRIDFYKKNIYIPKKFIENQEFSFLGEKYFLKFNFEYSTPFIFENNIFINKEIENDWENVFYNWYRQEAIKIFNKRALIFSKLIGVNYKQIKLSIAKTRWGSCSSLGNINLSWRLIMAPLEIIDYVIVHELAHLLQANHSPKFWAEVQKILPDYKNRRKWLKENGHSLRLI